YSSRTALGWRLIPTPRGASSRADSKRVKSTPIWCSVSPMANPPMPPPAMRTRGSVTTLLFECPLDRRRLVDNCPGGVQSAEALVLEGAHDPAQFGQSLQPADGGVAGLRLAAEIVENVLAVVGAHGDLVVAPAFRLSPRLL